MKKTNMKKTFVYLSQDIFNKIKILANKNDMKISSFIRLCVNFIIEDVDKKKSNLNQFKKFFNR